MDDIRNLVDISTPQSGELENRSASFGTLLGRSLGSGLQNLAQQKLGELQKQHSAVGLSKILNIPVEEAMGLLDLGVNPEKLIQIFWERGGANPQQEGQQGSISSQVLSRPPARELREQKKLELAERAANSAEQEKEIAHQEKLRPFLHKEEEQYKAAHDAYKYAKKMLKLLRANKANWPGAIAGNLPPDAQNLLIRNPAVREYKALGNNLVAALASTRKGQLTNYKIKFEEGGKAGLNQPYQTQEGILEGIIDAYDEEKARQRFRHAQKGGKEHYPLNIEERLGEFALAQDNPLEYPQYFEEGTRYPADDGKIYVIRDGQWEEEK